MSHSINYNMSIASLRKEMMEEKSMRTLNPEIMTARSVTLRLAHYSSRLINVRLAIIILPPKPIWVIDFMPLISLGHQIFSINQRVS